MHIVNSSKKIAFFALVVCSSSSLAQFTPGPEFYNQPALSAINLLAAYSAGLSGAGVRIGVVDTGINLNHVEFTNAIVAGYNAVTGVSGTSDFSGFLQDHDIVDGHGSHVASIAAGRLDGDSRKNNMQGVAYNASLVIGAINFKVEDADVSSAYISSALDYVSSQGAKVINNSWGSDYGSLDPSVNYQYFREYDPNVISAIKTALDRGSVLVFAAGNAGKIGSVAKDPLTPAILPYYDPEVAAKGGFIVVAATTNDGKSLAYYSNRCGVSKEYCIAAPGGSGNENDSLSDRYIIGAYGGEGYGNATYMYMAGTSMATPIVSGAVAIVAEQFPWMTNKNLATTVLTTGTRASAPDDDWGRGLLDVGKAIKGPGLFETDFEANVPRGYAPVFSNDIGYRTGMDGGLVKQGAGTLTLTGTDTYTGQTLINAGTLAVNGSLVSPVTVAANGTLRGTGNLSGALTVNGTLAPGNSTGTLTVANNVTMNAGSVYQVGIDRAAAGNASNYSHLVVTQAVTLPDNANINVDVTGPGYSVSTTKLQDIIKASTLNSNGTFGVTDNALLFNFGAVKEGNTVDLTIAADGSNRLAFAVNSTGNRPAAGAAMALNHAIVDNPTGALAGMFSGFTTGQERQLSDAVSQTLPLLSGSSTAVAQSALGRVNGIVQNRLEGVRGSGMASGDPAFGEKNLWLKPFGSWADQDSRKGVPGYSADTGGIVFGADAAISLDSRLGLSFAYANSRITGDSSVAPNSARVEVYQLLGYGSTMLAPDMEITYQVGVGQNSTEGHRTLSFASGNAKSRYHSPTLTAGIGLEKTVKLYEKTSFSPSIHADYIHIKDRAYRESGSPAINPLLLHVESRSDDELILGLNGKLSHKLNDSITLSVNAGAGYDVLDSNTSITASYAGAPGAAFSTHGINQSPWLGQLGLGLMHRIKNGGEITARYDAETRTGFTNHSASLKMAWMF